MKSFWMLVAWISALPALRAQDADTTQPLNLTEVVVIEKRPLNQHIQQKPLSALDEYLEQAPGISMVRRGSYAWEPMINGMTAERVSVTIDGMHIFGACTDRMDPVTSYVDISNLSEIAIAPGQQGAAFGPTVGGSINLARKKHDFCHDGWGLALDAGLESNGLLQTYGAALNYGSTKFFFDADFMYRHAGNYTAGRKQEVPYSQFTKYNMSGAMGFRINDKHRVSASLIYDRAVDIGYPALPMDVSLAQAQIVSLEHIYEKPTVFLKRIETRVYYNQVKHRMDDTQRPDVLMHMDMPGESKTYGVYARFMASKGKHEFNLNLNSYNNQSLADMTMYPDDPEEAPMYMYTWPDLRTQYGGFQAEHRLNWNKRHRLQYSAGLGWQRHHIASSEGLASLRIFYPEAAASRNRVLPAAGVHYGFNQNRIDVRAGIGYGERAPSVSEGFGYYLFNSFDRFDYIGNPELNNERSLEFNTALDWKTDKFSLNLTGSYYHLFNYIIGVPDAGLSVMTLGAAGVKVYEALPGANLFATELRLECRPAPSWKLRSALAYNLGRDNRGENLPLIRPFSFRFGLAYKYRYFDIELYTEGSARQTAFSAAYGEDETPAYATLNLAAGYTLLLKDHRIYFRAGLENIANSRYSTFSDWNNIPAKGINAFVNVSYVLDKKMNRVKAGEPIVKAD